MDKIGFYEGQTNIPGISQPTIQVPGALQSDAVRIFSPYKLIKYLYNADVIYPFPVTKRG